MASATDWERWARFIGEREAHLASRVVECLNAPALFQRRLIQRPDEGLQVPMRLGLLTVDNAAMTDCLAALTSASCDDIARLAEDTEYDLPRRWRVAPFSACKAVLVGRVPRTGRCLTPFDCQAPAALACTPDTGACSGTCRAPDVPASLGESCQDRPCPVGAVCRLDPLPSGALLCAAAGDGSPCMEAEHCLPGYFCYRTTADESPGKCRLVQSGGSCSASWSCPRTLACVTASPGAPGVCRAGKGEGESCVVHGRVGADVFSDCAFQYHCADLDGNGTHCVATSPPGQRCGIYPGPLATELVIACAEGYCDVTRVCRPSVSIGAACSSEDSCIFPGECRLATSNALVCIPPPEARQVGAPCLADGDDRACTSGAYCHPDPPGVIPGMGHCQAFKPAGETCPTPGDRCEYLTSCVDGICKGC